MNKIHKEIIAVMTMLFCANCSSEDSPSKPPDKPQGSDVSILMTLSNQTILGQQMPSIDFDEYMAIGNKNVIHLDLATEYQEVDGFGAALTGSSSYLLKAMSPEKRAKVLKELFDPEEGLGISVLRLAIGACDYSLGFYTYCDVPGIENFAIYNTDKTDLLPVLKEILAINPNIKIFATTWSAPKWMRTADQWTGNNGASGIKDEYLNDFATYYLKYVQAMAAEGIKIYAITPQNEPLSNGNAMSMMMTATQQIAFIKSLGAKFSANGITTKIICFDHNWNLNQFVKDVYSDPQAFAIADGAAFHAYGGSLQGQIEIKNQYPTKNIYFTEQSGGGWAPDFQNNFKWWMNNIFIGGMNNWSKCVILWNLILDDKHGPFLTPGAATNCYGLLETGSNDTYKRYSEYYVMKQMRGIRTGAIVVKTYGYSPSGLSRFAVKNTDGSKILVVFNETGADQTLTISDGIHCFTYMVKNEALISFKWK